MSQKTNKPATTGRPAEKADNQDTPRNTTGPRSQPPAGVHNQNATPGAEAGNPAENQAGNTGTAGPRFEASAQASANTNASEGGPKKQSQTKAGPSGPQEPSQTGAQHEDPVATLQAQVEDLTKRLLTAHADIQNLHKRFDRERTETAKYAITKFARDTVAVADNFERAIASVPEDATKDNPVLKALLDGVTMTEREFLNVLERHGVKRDNPEGELFDPHRHQAVMEENDSSILSGTILKVFQPGYVIEDRVLRPAMVVVAKGGPKNQNSDDQQTPDTQTPGPIPDSDA